LFKQSWERNRDSFGDSLYKEIACRAPGWPPGRVHTVCAHEEHAGHHAAEAAGAQMEEPAINDRDQGLEVRILHPIKGEI
jgi:hypothetical protein